MDILISRTFLPGKLPKLVENMISAHYKPMNMDRLHKTPPLDVKSDLCKPEKLLNEVQIHNSQILQ